MMDYGVYLASQDIAVRSGVARARYRIADGRFVLDSKDLSRVRLTSQEYITGLQGVERTDEETARALIAQNGHQMGLPADNSADEVENLHEGEDDRQADNAAAEEQSPAEEGDDSENETEEVQI